MDSFPAALRQLREEAGLSLAALAARSKVSKSHIGNLESGAREPNPAVVRALDHALGVGGFLVAVAGEADQVRRRTLLAGLGMGAGVLTGSAVSEVLRHALMASLDATVDDWHEIAETHGQDYMTVPAADLQARLTRDLACLRPALADHPQLWAVACRLAALEAMTSTSLGDKPQGERWWRTARLAGTRSGDSSVILWLQGRAAFRAAHENVDPRTVLRMAEDVDAAEAHAARAWAFARLGDRRTATSAIEAARTALDRFPPATQPTMYKMAPWRLSLAESRVFALLRDKTAMWSALGDVPPDMVEWTAHREICIALAESTTGDRPSGLARANAALEMLPEASRVSVVRNLVHEVSAVGTSS
ncbi:helix-turn-helix domain-containing protein [Actinosynnema sp. CS-041913]|uniref:helix-turn-helix domain-containing protein n=1 Tax=Actinosynnema sp. CS-041913 TaxID=3239917 RepID=UPI003D912B15